MKSESRLTVEFEDGSVDEYRIRKSNVEFRPRYRVHSTPWRSRREWRRLDKRHISLHLALDTPVGEWLMVRLLKSSRLST